VNEQVIAAYLVEGVEKLGNQRGALAGGTKHTLETEPVEAADEAVGRGTESERVTPEVPLEGDDGSGEHAGPDEGEGRLSASKTRV
jgi:hypothetical protein